MMFKNSFTKILIVLIVVSCGKKQNKEEQTQPPPQYPILVLKNQDATLQAVYPVTIRGQEDIDVKPRIEGFIEAIYVDEGARVKRGDRLFRINSPQTIEATATAQANLNSAIAQANTAKLNVDRMQPLADKGIISNVQLESYKNSYQSARAAQAQAQAALTNANAVQQWMTVTSPVDGVVGSISFRQGSLVNSNTSLTTVASTGNVYAYFSLNEKELMDLLNNLEGNTQEEKIKNIPQVSLTLADGTEYPEKGNIETIAGVVNTTTGSVSFRAKFPNLSGLLRSGTSGKVYIPQHLENVLVIPQKATFSLQDKTLAYKVQGDSVVQKVISVIDVADGRNYVVQEGLVEGDTIAADGVATLHNGMKIRVNEFEL